MTSHADRDIAAARYVARIRNNRKRAYASAYLALMRGETTAEPERGELSYMGAQAVEMRLRAIWRGEEV